MATYMLILRDDPKHWAKFTPAQMQKVLEKYMAWGMQMRESGSWLAGNKLKDEGGKIVRKDANAKGLKVVDGPFAESKDVIGGYYLLKADSYAHCVELLKDHPHLEQGFPIDIREVDPMPGD